MTTEKLDPENSPDLEEINLLAYILGELEEAERREVEQRLIDEPEFAKKRDELEQAAGFMKEAFSSDALMGDSDENPIQLSQDRRNKIFENIAPKHSRLLRFDFNHPLIPIAVAARPTYPKNAQRVTRALKRSPRERHHASHSGGI